MYNNIPFTCCNFSIFTLLNSIVICTLGFIVHILIVMDVSPFKINTYINVPGLFLLLHTWLYSVLYITHMWYKKNAIYYDVIDYKKFKKTQLINIKWGWLFCIIMLCIEFVFKLPYVPSEITNINDYAQMVSYMSYKILCSMIALGYLMLMLMPILS